MNVAALGKEPYQGKFGSIFGVTSDPSIVISKYLSMPCLSNCSWSKQTSGGVRFGLLDGRHGVRIVKFIFVHQHRNLWLR
jgi:hypothetical protein